MSTIDGLSAGQPLEPDDPPRLGEFRLEGRLLVDDSGVVYRGVRDGDPTAAVAVLILGAGAHADPAARGRFLRALDLVGEADPGRIAAADTDPDIAPWVAVPLADGEVPPTVRGLLADVALQRSPTRPARGPQFAPYWHPRRGPGFWRLWPLPWPDPLNTASRLAYLVALLMIAVLATLAVLVALWLFGGQPPSRVPLPTRPSNVTPTGSPTPTPSPSTTPTPSEPSPSPSHQPSPTVTLTGPPPIV